MAIDWSKYGIENDRKSDSSTPNLTSVDWSKYNLEPSRDIARRQSEQAAIQAGEFPVGQTFTATREQPSLPQQETTSQSNGRVQSFLRDYLQGPVRETNERIGQWARFIPAAADALATAVTPDAPNIGRQPDGSWGYVEGPTARERAESRQRSTGDERLDRAAEVTGNIGSYLFNPVAPSAGPIALYNSPGVQRVAQRVGQAVTRRTSMPGGITPELPSRIAQEATREGLAAAAYSPTYSLLQGQSSPQEIAQNVALEGGFGVATGGAVPVIGRVVRPLLEKYRPREVQRLLALPEPRQRGNVNRAQPPEVITDADTRPLGLPESTPETRQRFQNVQEARLDLDQTNQAIRELDNEYQRAIVEQYQFLKQQLAERRPRQRGGLIRDQSGEVTGAFPPVSNKPVWLQQFEAQHKKRPNNRELYELAKKHVDEGFMDDVGSVPSWKSETNYDELRDALVSVRDEIQKGIRDVSPSLRVVDSPLVEETVRGIRRQEPTPSVQEPRVTETPPERISPEPQPERISPERRPLKDDAIELLKELWPSRNLGISAMARRAKPYENLQTSTKSQLVSKLDREPFSASEKTNQAYIDFVDDLQRINQFDKFVERTLGIDRLQPTQRPYDLALASRVADIISNQIITKNMVDSAGNVVGQSLKNIMGRIPRGAYVDFEDYLLNRHAITRAKRGERVYRKDLKWTPEKGRENIAKLEAQYPMFRELADEYYEFNNNMVKNWLVDTGLLTREMAAKWVKENPTYVPMQRYFSVKAGRGPKSKKGFADQRAPVKRYAEEGSTRPIYSPIETTIENVDAFVKAAKRNQVVQALVRNLQRSPEDFREWAEIVPGGSLEDIRQTLKENDIDGLISKLNEDFEMVFSRPSNRGLDKDNIITGMVDGRPVQVKIKDRQLLEALKALTPDGQHWLMDALGQVTRFFKVLTTGLNPIFGLTRNIFRDINQAFIARQQSTLPEFGRDLVESFVSAMGDGELYQQYKNIGGGHASPIAADRNLLAQSKRAVLPQNRLTGWAPRAFDAVENFMNALEAVPRLGEFKRAGMSTADERLRGLLAAQDVTTNFKRRGRIGRQIDQAFPYFNAAVQGLDRLVRMYRDNPVQALTRTFMGITVPTIALYALNYDNPDFRKLNNYVRDNYFMIPTGDGKFIRIAKHRELGIPFSAAVERALDQWLHDDPESFRGFADAVRVAFFPPGLSGAFEDPGLVSSPLGGLQDTILGPFVDVAKNETFTGAPIVSGGLQNLSPELQYDENTSRVSRFLGDMTGSSPKQLDHLLRSYLGVIGQFGIPLTAPGGNAGEALQRQVVVDPVYSSKVQNRFYEIKEELDRANADSRATGQPLDENTENMRQVYNQVNRIMSELRAASRQIEDSDLPDDQKKKYARDIRARINELAEKTNEVYRENRP